MPVSYLNDFIFCPYSVYLHQIYDKNNETIYSAKPQKTGKYAHDKEELINVSDTNIIKNKWIVSLKLGVYGKIDRYCIFDKTLIEGKYDVKKIYRGYFYQIWCYYFGMTEMGYTIHKLYIESLKDRDLYPIALPGIDEFNELQSHIKKIAWYDFEQDITPNIEKCIRCIYASLCDKTNNEHVYA